MATAKDMARSRDQKTVRHRFERYEWFAYLTNEMKFLGTFRETNPGRSAFRSCYEYTFEYRRNFFQCINL